MTIFTILALIGFALIGEDLEENGNSKEQDIEEY